MQVDPVAPLSFYIKNAKLSCQNNVLLRRFHIFRRYQNKEPARSQHTGSLKSN